MPFTFTNDPHLYGLEISLIDILMTGLFCSNNRMVRRGMVSQGGVSKSVKCLQMLLILSKRSIVHFCRWRGWHRTWGAIKLVIFCDRHKCMTPKWFKITTNASIRGSSRYNSLKPSTHSSPHSTDEQTKAPVTFSWYLIFYVKKYLAY